MCPFVMSQVESCSDSHPRPDDKSIELSLEGTDDAISGSAALIEILVPTSLDNAIRYTPPGGSVECRIDRRDRGICLAVSVGPGFAKGAG